MINWLKRYWILLVAGFGILFLFCGVISGLVLKLKYEELIKEKDVTISELWGEIGDSKKRETKWKASSRENWDLAMEKEKKLRRKDKEMAVKIHEKRALQKKIREMPATQVIVRTIEIINCPDVVQQERGVVFTLDCAKDNLTVLENVFYFKKEALDWADQFVTSQGVVADLKNVIIAKDGAYAERGVQLTSAYKISGEWEGKFNLSEKRGKRSWWKGFKKGVTIGGIAGGIIVFILRK